MRKTLFYTFAGLTLMVLSVSCSKTATGGQEIEARFVLDLSQGSATKVDGVSEAAHIDALDVFVYDASGAYLSTIVPTVTKTDQTHYNVSIRLLNNVTYSFVFFAQKSGTYAYSADKKTITVDYSAMLANSDDADAFCARVSNYNVSGSFTRTVTLTRPFAQINVGSAKADYQAAEASKLAFDATLKTTFSVKQAPTVMNLLTGQVSVPKEIEFLANVYMGNASASSTLSVSGTAFPGATPVRYMGMVYVLADPSSITTLTKVGISVTGLQNGNAFSATREVTNIPVRANYRTQIVGNVFTEEGAFNISLDPDFHTPDNEGNI